ncbi:MAG: metal ABC transporter substrate-binding protein [Deinococcales bacterium]
MHPYTSLVQQLIPEAKVTQLLAAGASPHFFDPKPSQMRAVAEADLIIINGGVDEWLKAMIAASGSKAQVLDILELLGDDLPIIETALIRGEAAADGHDQEDDHDHEGINAHIWLDPIMMIEAMKRIADSLINSYPEKAESLKLALEKLIRDLQQLDSEITAILSPVQAEAFYQLSQCLALFCPALWA